ncbi:ribonuclease III [Pyrenochaeta sp. DS3sAY3a]|nr:ribonuclease III [Pyrenochaeta sp. DS3sAY3a]
MSDLQTIQKRLHYSFKNAQLLQEAFIADGATNSRHDIEGPPAGNKRLALVGDAVLRLSIFDDWFPSGDSTANGHELLQEVATNDQLQHVAKNWHLQNWLTENPSQAGQAQKTTLASTVEAIIGAVWIDSDRNFPKVQEVIHQLNGRTNEG